MKFWLGMTTGESTDVPMAGWLFYNDSWDGWEGTPVKDIYIYIY